MPTSVDAWHRRAAVTANNETLALIAEPDPDPRDVVRGAYAAAHHWDRVPGKTVVNEVRALYLIGKAWWKVGRGELALEYADRVMAATVAEGFGDFDLAYAHELRARALLALGRTAEGLDAVRAARAVPIADSGDAEWLTRDLADLPQ